MNQLFACLFVLSYCLTTQHHVLTSIPLPTIRSFAGSPRNRFGISCTSTTHHHEPPMHLSFRGGDSSSAPNKPSIRAKVSDFSIAARKNFVTIRHALNESAHTFQTALRQTNLTAVMTEEPPVPSPPKESSSASSLSKKPAFLNSRRRRRRHDVSKVSVPPSILVGMRWIKFSIGLYILIEILDYCGWIDQERPNKLKQNAIRVWSTTKPKVERWQTRVQDWWNSGKQEIWHPATWKNRHTFLTALQRVPPKYQFGIGAWVGILFISPVTFLFSASAMPTATMLPIRLKRLSIGVLKHLGIVYACSELNFTYKRQRVGWNLKEITGGNDTVGEYIDVGLESVRVNIRNAIQLFLDALATKKRKEDAMLDEEINNVLMASGGSSSFYFNKLRQQFLDLQQGIKEIKDEMGVTTSNLISSGSDMFSKEGGAPEKLTIPSSLRKGFMVGIAAGFFLLQAAE